MQFGVCQQLPNGKKREGGRGEKRGEGEGRETGRQGGTGGGREGGMDVKHEMGVCMYVGGNFFFFARDELNEMTLSC